MSKRTVAWLSLGLLTLHNAEEAMTFRTHLPQMSTSLSQPFASIAASLSYPELLVALAVVEVVALSVALSTATWPQSPRVLWVFLTLEAVLALNVIGHVVSAFLVFDGYSPGLATALLFNAPFAIYCFRRAGRERWVSAAAMRATVPAALLLHGPILMGGLWLAGKASQ